MAVTAEPITATLERTAAELARLRKQRNELIRQHPGTLRAIGKAAQLSPERVRQIKLEGEQT